MTQLSHLDANYNGGMRAYIQNAKRLLDDSREGAPMSAPYTLEERATFNGQCHPSCLETFLQNKLRSCRTSRIKRVSPDCALSG